MTLESLDDVRLFRQVVASGSITAAALALGENKNRVSRRLAALERALGARLADRTTRSWRLTEAGERFDAAAAELLDAVERAVAVVRPEPQESGSVRVAVRSALTGLGLGEQIARLLEGAPHLRIQILVIDEAIDQSTLDARGIDLAVQVGPQRDSSLVARHAGDVAFVLCATRAYLARHGHPRHPRELAGHECVRRLGSPPETHWPLIGPRARQIKAELGGRIECSDARLQSEILYAGFGVGLRPAREVRRAAEAGVLEQVLPRWRYPPIPVWLVGTRGRFKLARVARVAALIGDVVRGLS